MNGLSIRSRSTEAALLVMIGDVFTFLLSDTFFLILSNIYGFRLVEDVSVFFRTIEAVFTNSLIIYRGSWFRSLRSPF